MTELTRRLGLEEPLHTALLSGRPAREIVRYAQDHGVDLIVVGTHGRTGVTRVLLGSVAEAVVRLSSCPVLAVPSAAWPVEAPALRLPTSDATPHFCVVCVRETDDLICETCRSKIRGGAREWKPEADREG